LVFRVLLLVVTILVLGTSAVRAAAISSWSMAGHDAQNTAFNPDETRLSITTISRLHVVWTAPAVENAIATDQRVYVIALSRTGASSVNVLNATDGHNLLTVTPKMLHLSSAPGDAPNALAHPDDTLIVGSSREVVALNPHTGTLRWYQYGGATALTVDGSTLYTGKDCRNACGAIATYALNVTNGKRLWQHPHTVEAAPVAANGLLYSSVGSYGRGRTDVYDPTTGTLVGTFTVNPAWLGDATHAYAFFPAISNSTTGKTSRGWIGQISPSGGTVWKADLGRVTGGNPVFAYHELFVPSNRHSPGVIALDAKSGRYLWGANVGPSSSMVAANGLLYVLNSAAGRLSVLSIKTGASLRVLTLPTFKGTGTGTLMIAGGQVYVRGAKGLVALGV
jgi:outer membrane protein assembly factor BamB